MRLGWLRHGAGIADLRFLDLDWIFQPSLPYWAAHMQNLTQSFMGLLGIGAATLVLLHCLVAKRGTEEIAKINDA